MGRISKYPSIIDDAQCISISDLKKWNYLKPNQITSGVVTWSINGNKTGGINIEVDTGSMTLRISFTYRKEIKVDYIVKLVTVKSNLGKGEIIYFLCPHTKKRCRKLYGIGKEFLHRTAYKNVLYKSQATSKNRLEQDKFYSSFYKNTILKKELNSKHFKAFYNGKPTKRYLKIMKELNRYSDLTYSEIERLQVVSNFDKWIYLDV